MPTSTSTSTPQTRSQLIVAALGAALVAGFFLPWTDLWVSVTGWDVATEGGDWWMFLIPLGGLALVAAAVLAPALAPLATLVVGLGVTAWFGYYVVVVTAAVYGWGVSVVVGGAVLAVAGALMKKPAMSAVGGFAMIGGFFCPWIDPGHISGYDLARQNGLGAIAIAAWAVPIGGALAAYGAGKRDTGRSLAGFGGVVGLAAIGYLTYRILGGLLWAFGGWGYYLVIGAGVAALGVGLARIRAARR